MRGDLDLVEASEPQSLDSTDDQETTQLEEAHWRALVDHERAKVDDLIQDRDQRKTYGRRLYWLIVAWLIVIGLIVLLHGFICIPFELSVTIMATLIGSTTASVLGLFAIVANYLFPKRQNMAAGSQE